MAKWTQPRAGLTPGSQPVGAHGADLVGHLGTTTVAGFTASSRCLGLSQQAELVQVGGVFVDECGRQVWNVFIRTDFGCPHCRMKRLGGGGGAA
jgi:hypothetical protein